MVCDRLRNDLITTMCVAVSVLVWASPPSAQAQENCPPAASVASEEALRLVVKLISYSESKFYQYGTGIVIGDRGDTLLIATAAHVVLDATTPVDSVHAFFYTQCDRLVRARICRRFDPKRNLDLAVLCVPAAAVPGIRPSWSRMGNARRLSARTPVYPVGCPAGRCWEVGQPDKVLVASSKQPRIVFTTFFVSPGHSGGPLFNEWWEVVGMLTIHGQPLSEALPIDSVLNAACDANCRRQEQTLKAPFVPRGGYRLSLGLNGLFAKAVGDPGGRFPAGRANLMYRVNPLLELHAGSIRLTPQNLSVTGAMLGLGLNLPSRTRVWLNPFLEGGFGHVEGRFDAGGHYINNNGTNVYVPLWQQVKDDALGYGAGVSVMGLVAPRTIVEVIVGHWSFNRPPNAPRMPDLVWGAGLRLGM
jgi:hypothetical protein